MTGRVISNSHTSPQRGSASVPQSTREEQQATQAEESADHALVVPLPSVNIRVAKAGQDGEVGAEGRSCSQAPGESSGDVHASAKISNLLTGARAVKERESRKVQDTTQEDRCPSHLSLEIIEPTNSVARRPLASNPCIRSHAGERGTWLGELVIVMDNRIRFRVKGRNLEKYRRSFRSIEKKMVC